MRTHEQKTQPARSRSTRLRSARLRNVLLVAVGTTPWRISAQEGAPHVSDWSISLGAGAVVLPRYQGSDEYWVLPFPMGQVTYRDRFYVGPSTNGTMGGGMGVYFARSRLSTTVRASAGARHRPLETLRRARWTRRAAGAVSSLAWPR